MGATIFSTICIVLLLQTAKANLIVDTDLGKVQGVEVTSIIKDEKYYSFMGIPYGKAPVGRLKFKPPEPHDKWDNVFNAKKERPHCTQFNLPIRYIKNYGVCGLDDCLHLSVYTPKLPTENEVLNLPVVVFLYNEHFRLTHNASNDYGPDFFVKEDVILVSVSHRLNVPGFLAYEDELLPGNNGLRDVILALKWIQRNIHKFGGDTLNITLMGVDGGAVIADILLHSPKAKGLFGKVILQSGTSWNPLYFPPSPKKKADALIKHLDRIAVTSNSMIKELSTFTTHTLVEADLMSIDADEGRVTQRPTIPFAPVIEPEHPDAIISKLPENGPIDIDIPVMVGYNSRASLEGLSHYMSTTQYLTFADRDFMFNFPVRDHFSFDINSNIYFHAMQEIKDFYFEEGYIKITKPSEYITYTNDIMFFYPVDYTVRKYVNESIKPVYYYTFDYSGELNMRKKKILESSMTVDGTWGATAGDELCYLFVCKPIKKVYQEVLKDEDSEELKVLNNMIKMWTNFAKSGNPTPPDSEFTWLPATKENKECLVISDELQMKNNLHEERVEFWDNFLVKYKAMAINGVIKDVKDEL